MCGIVGYYTYNVSRDLQYVLDTLFNGLKRLEYRGYDSAGVAFDVHDTFRLPGQQDADAGADDAAPDATASTSGQANGVHHAGAARRFSPMIIKEVGKVEALQRLTLDTLGRDQTIDLGKQYRGQCGIAHTRWATHGQPSAINSHPHTSDSEGEFVVVHNGIITNYNTLREYLVKHGETFVSETDTEVIPKLCRFIFARLPAKPTFPKLVMEVLKRLEGASAVLVKSTHYPGELVAFKRGSPMILGVREGQGPDAASATSGSGSSSRGTAADGAATPQPESLEAFIASDASAVIEHTKKVVVLEDGDLLHLRLGGYGIYNLKSANGDEAVPRVLLTLQMEVEQIMKGGYDHYMQKEIHEQPESLQSTMRGRVQFLRPATGNPYVSQRIKLGGMVEHGASIKRSRRIIFIACGTSFHAATAARQVVEEMSDLPVVLEIASDFLDRRCPIYRDDACIFMSQSGETADTLRALEYAKARGALCIGVTNTVGSAISRGTHCGLHLNAGYEIGVASTKAYTSQIVAVTMVALQLAEDSIGKRERRDQIIDEMGQLPGKVRKVLMLDQTMRQLAEELKSATSLLFFGRGYNYATALEAALKVKEVALVHSEGMLAGEMKHGPLALVDENMPIVVIATRDGMYKKMESVIQQLLARSARLYIVCAEGDANMRQYAARACALIEVPETVDCLQPVVNIVPLQLLAYHLTVLRGFNVDQPRNLAKSVTVSEEEH